MSRVLIVGEHASGRLNASTAKCVTCAAAIPGAELAIALFGDDTAAPATDAARLAGVARVLRFDHAANTHALAAVIAPQVAAIAADFTHVLGPSTTFGKDLMPRVAALIGVTQVSDIMAVESASRFRRPVYAGNAILTVEITAGRKVVATVRTASFEAAPSSGSAVVESRKVEASIPTHTRFVSLSSADAGRPDLQSARIVLSGGRALGSSDNFKLLYSIADKLGAAVGASRAAVDAGYAANDMQVGQTGKIIAPDLYIAVGISGAIQHLTGIKDARTIVAINKDSEAPIFEIADYGLVGDLFTVLPELEKLLS
ncbi:MAG TPA: electron transfer flavoprotein subunit alpha/FixB family protein [Steroidobacteraceae bacterium]|nr:electron transfer flavoprotein subunit alpha/FixB family protein [Steroidobacteraceae bacterium]